MKKTIVFILTAITFVVMLYLIKTLPRNSQDAINDKPVSDMFTMMDDVYEEHHE